MAAHVQDGQVFHASQLKLCKGEHKQPHIPLPFTNDELQPVI